MDITGTCLVISSMKAVAAITLLLMAMEVGTASASSLMSNGLQLDTSQVSFVEAVGWAGRYHLASCSYTLMDATNSDSSRILLSRLLNNLAATRNPYQVWTEKAWHLRAAGRTTCEAYIVLAQDVLSLLDWQHDGDSVWDRQGRYLVFTLSPMKDLHQLAALHLLKASDVYFFVGDSKTYYANLMSLVGCTWLPSGDGGERLAVYVHRRLPHPQLHYLTHWSPSLNVQDSRLFSNKVTKNLGGRTVRVLAVNHAPSVFSTADTSGRLHQISGLDIKVVKAIGEALNFTPEFYDPGPDRWGIMLPNNTFNGMVGLVSRGLAEVGVGNVFLTEVRARHVTFTTPYDFERACFLTPAPVPFPSWMAVTFPFTLHVWLLVMVSVVVTTMLVTVLGVGQVKQDKQLKGSPSIAFLFVLASLCNQSRPLPSRPSMQVMATGLILCGFVVSVFFSSNLTAFMTVVALRPPYTSIGQIIQSRLEVGGYSDFWVPLFRGSANPQVQRLGDNFYLFDNVFEFLKRVIEGRGVLVENTQHLQYLQQTFLIDHVGRSSVRIMFEECINPFGVGAMLTRDTPYKLSFDEIIQRLREGGLVNRFFWEVVREQRFQGNSILSLATEDQERSGVGSLTLNHLQGPFLVLGAGLGSALLLLLLRMAAVTIHKGVSRTSFVGRLIEHIGTHFNDI